jgi:hypothetical protein
MSKPKTLKQLKDEVQWVREEISKNTNLNKARLALRREVDRYDRYSCNGWETLPEECSLWPDLNRLYVAREEFRSLKRILKCLGVE